MSGYNKDLMGNFTTLANSPAIRVELLTSSEALIAACGDTSKYTAILLNTPSRRLSEAKDYSEAELAALVAFHDAGGTLIITGSGDSNDKAEPHVAATQNRVLEALGSALRLADDGTYGRRLLQPVPQRLRENALTDGLTDADLFSYYGGSSIYAVDGDGAAVSVLPDTVSPCSTPTVSPSPRTPTATAWAATPSSTPTLRATSVCWSWPWSSSGQGHDPRRRRRLHERTLT